MLAVLTQAGLRTSKEMQAIIILAGLLALQQQPVLLLLNLPLGLFPLE
jgi:hypothetical protein